MDKVKFDDWSDIKNCIECNECESYWTNQCDGSVIGSEKPCKAFRAIRRVDIPLQIKSLRTAVKWLSVSVIFLGVAMAILSLSRLVGG